MEKDKRGDALNRSTNDSGTSPNVITYIVIACFGGFLLGAIVFMALLQEGGMLNPAPTPTATTSPTDTHTPSATPTNTPTFTPPPTYTPYPTYTPLPTATPTNTPTSTTTDTPTATPTDTPTVTPTFTPPPTYTPYPTYTPLPTATPTNTALPPQIVHRSFEELGILVTSSEEAGQEVEVSVNAGIANLCGHGANHFSYGVIEAGIDFSNIDEDDISPPVLGIFGGYTIKAPAPQITSCRIEYITQYDGSFTLCGTNWDTVRQLAQYEAMAGFVDNAIENGILERAKAEASYAVGNFVSGLTGRSVQVEFEKMEGELELPPSCQSIIPSGWAKDESGTWKRE